MVINYESLHKVEGIFDLVILDEAHSMGAFPKPSKRAKQVKEMLVTYKNPDVILLSGTPTPESYSQMYHQVYGIKGNPFASFVNFYKFSKQYVNVKQRKINSLYINDYHDGHKSIIDMMKHTQYLTHRKKRDLKWILVSIFLRWMLNRLHTS